MIDRFSYSEIENDSQLGKKKLVQSLKENGYAIIENFLSEERAKAMKEELTALTNQTPIGRNNFEGFHTKRIYALFAKTRSFDDIAVHPLLLEVIEEILGMHQILLSSPVGIEVGPGEVEQLAHRDDGKYPIPEPHQEVIMNSMWAFDDFTESNGSTIIYPGSHKLNRKERGKLLQRIDEGNCSAAEKVSAVMPKGSVMLYLGSLLHGGGANKTENARMGVILEYCSGWLRPQENHCLAVPQEIVKNLPIRLMELLGYSVAAPFIGYVDGRDPKNVFFFQDRKITSRF